MAYRQNCTVSYAGLESRNRAVGEKLFVPKNPKLRVLGAIVMPNTHSSFLCWNLSPSASSGIGINIFAKSLCNKSCKTYINSLAVACDIPLLTCHSSSVVSPDVCNARTPPEDVKSHSTREDNTSLEPTHRDGNICLSASSRFIPAGIFIK